MQGEHEDIGDARQVHSDSEHVRGGATMVDERGYTSDDPGRRMTASVADNASGSLSASSEWIHVQHPAGGQSKIEHLSCLNKRGYSLDCVHPYERESHCTTFAESVDVDGRDSQRTRLFERGTVVLRGDLSRHEPAAFLKLADTLAFLLRDAAHVRILSRLWRICIAAMAIHQRWAFR